MTTKTNTDTRATSTTTTSATTSTHEKDLTTKKTLTIHRSTEKHWVGDGFPVRSAFSYNDLGRELSPFLMLDYAEPYEFKPAEARRGVGAHPHRGFETVTIVYQGELEHRDSFGGGGKIGPGDVQWMTAGSGLLHDEFHSDDFTRKGGTFEVIQLWVNLRAKDKDAKPAYQTLLANQIPTATLRDAAGAEAGTARIIAGELKDVKGPAHTFTPMNLWDVKLAAGKRVELPLAEGHTAALLLLRGTLKAGGDSDARAGDLVIFDREGSSITLEAREDSAFLLMSGEPIDEPMFGYGPFVMNNAQEIQQAMSDFRAGKYGYLE